MALKNTIIILLIAVSLVACNKDEKNNAPERAFDVYSPTANDVLVGDGIFTAYEPLTVLGSAKVYRNSFYHLLRFENFSINNGPNLRVYLSKSSENIDESINIDDLKAVTGSFNYTFSVNTDMQAFKHVIVLSDDNKSIYCVATL